MNFNGVKLFNIECDDTNINSGSNIVLFNSELDKIICGDSSEELKKIEDESVDCCITSPPYYGLRDYGTATWVGGDPNCPHYRVNKIRGDNTLTGHKTMMLSGNAVGDSIYKKVCPICGAVRVDNQIGLEETPDEYIQKLVVVFREIKRVLKPQGTLWVNIGDSYASKVSNNRNFIENDGRGSNNDLITEHNFTNTDIKPKDLIGIPWMLAFALRADGWYLRQDIIWSKPNPMPESVKDRCTKSHEYVFLLTKSSDYYFNADSIKTMSKKNSIERSRYGLKTARDEGMNGSWDVDVMGDRFVPTLSNRRDVWSIPVANYKEAHFATYPEELVELCLSAGCPEYGTVIDPFFGSGTTGVVALKQRKHFIGIELNSKYIELAKKRLIV